MVTRLDFAREEHGAGAAMVGAAPVGGDPSPELAVHEDGDTGPDGVEEVADGRVELREERLVVRRLDCVGVEAVVLHRVGARLGGPP